MYCVYGNSSWYIDCCPLYGRCPLLGVSVIGDSTVYVLPPDTPLCSHLLSDHLDWSHASVTPSDLVDHNIIARTASEPEYFSTVLSLDLSLLTFCNIVLFLFFFFSEPVVTLPLSGV